MSTEEKSQVIRDWLVKINGWKRMPRIEIHEEWHWIMLIVETIYAITDNEELKEVREINNEGLVIFELGIGTPKDEVFEACFKFIEWYNSNVKEK